MAYNQYDLNATSLVKTGNLTEMYIPLWWYSSGSDTINSAAHYFLQKGTTSVSNSVVSSCTLHTLNSNWSTTQKFALEVSVKGSGGGYSANAELYDITSNNVVSSSAVSTTNSTFTVVRSGQFTLTPGHSYGVRIWTDSSSVNVYLTKASLIAFLG